ncbi:heme peroxidase [Roseivivax sp. THAF40]|uniref:peroxidase family protein n=1 Tax=Roseivivax sp. THAF40 TaxID=2587858 RepID=UPI001267E934|nr:peroxidase family protein [Roseivivax sp. THAF40]QFT46580.1 heme peroxidase [Roseivivax sp. THAF40]
MTRVHHGLSRYDQLVKSHIAPQDARHLPLPATFGRLLPANSLHLENLTHPQLIEIYEGIALGMGKKTDKSGEAAAGLTFFGQFVDHDITLDATSALGTRIVPATIPNVRTPSLDLDCVYGSGPEASPHLYGNSDASGYLLYGNATNEHDLARTPNGTALIGDPRNDENGIVSQIQANFIALHNILMTEVEHDADTRKEVFDCAHMGMNANDWHDHVPSEAEIFEAVRRFLRMHYQFAVWTELLPAFVQQSCLDHAMTFDDFGAGAAIMPVEFSGAAYRFGHATAQPDYAMAKDGGQISMSDILGFGLRDSSAEMRMFFDLGGTAAQKARPVGTTLGLPLTNLMFINHRVHLEEINHTLTLDQSRNLPLRNMLRDRYTYQLANGEKIRDWFKTHHHRDLPEVERHADLKKNGIVKTPLWFYCLQEAEQHGHGKLTGVGGAIVASVFARLLRLDPTTYWHASGFHPSTKFDDAGGLMAGMMAYAEAHRGNIAHAAALKAGG